MNFAIYARKSVYSDRSDSVRNQIQMCRDYISVRFRDKKVTFTEFFDEGFSGKDTERPALERMMDDVTSGKVDALVVYQLDRLSRNIRDFSEIYEILEKKNVMFVSIKENIDTATPIGKAMMYITMVFAQMERETIAQRVKDNMEGLAKKGYWTGGKAPQGYKTERVTVDGKTHVMIVPDPKKVEFVREVFNDFTNNDFSLSKMQSTYLRNGKRTDSGAFFSPGNLHSILTTPFFVQNTVDVWDYYNELGCRMMDERDEWDGTHGVMAYGRRGNISGRNTVRETSEWIICAGIHEYIIDDKTWLSAQKKLKLNKFEKTSKYEPALLKGVLRCGKCGSMMSVQRKKTNGKLYSSYKCQKRIFYGSEVCDLPQIKCDLIDKKVIEAFSGIETNNASIKKYIPVEDVSGLEQEIKELKKRSAAIRQKIDRLTSFIVDGSASKKYILDAIEKEDASLTLIEEEMFKKRSVLEEKSKGARTAEEKANDISKLMKNLSGFSDTEKNKIMREIIQECRWDGDSLFLRF